MTKLSLAVAAFVAISAPAFAGDNDLKTLDADSGRIIAQNQSPSRFEGAYASAAPTQTIRQNATRNYGAFQGSNEATQFAPQY